MRPTVRGLFILATLTFLAARPAAAAAPDLRLVNAAAAQDKAAIRTLLKQGIDVNAKRADGATALLWAVHFNDAETIDLLLKAGANVNAADDHGVTPLSQATENNDPALVQRLLAAGANANAGQTSGMTPLMIAAHTGNVEIAKALIARGANVNAVTTETGNTPLMWAVADRRPEVARVLIENKSDVHRSSVKGFNALMYAAGNGDIEMAKMLIAAGADVNERASDGTQVLPFAIFSGQPQFALFLLEQGARADGSMGGVQALHLAAGPVDMWLEPWARVRYGVSRYSSGGGGGAGGRMSADQRLKLVNALLARGADPNARITVSAMMMSYIGYPKKGAFEPFACGTGDLLGATPLFVAAMAANTSDRSLFAMGAAPGERDMAEAGRGDPTAILRALVAGGGDLKLTTIDGTTALMVAAGLGRATFDPNLKRGRRSPSAERAVTYLLDAGANINAVNEADFTALHGAAFRGLNEVIKILVDRGANMNARDFRGRTPYRLAEGSKQSFQFQAYPETAAYMKELGFDTTLGVPGTVQERNRDVAAAAAAAMAQKD
ncbi:MAG TPA: ankyrin repeat domain-containing protein [Vicinamibacterales bacterium]